MGWVRRIIGRYNPVLALQAICLVNTRFCHQNACNGRMERFGAVLTALLGIPEFHLSLDPDRARLRTALFNNRQGDERFLLQY